jgi:hypothetical protein
MNFDYTTAPVHFWQNVEFIFVIFADKSLFWHGVRCGKATIAGYVVFVETGLLVERVYVFIK